MIFLVSSIVVTKIYIYEINMINIFVLSFFLVNVLSIYVFISRLQKIKFNKNVYKVFKITFYK